MPRIDDINVRKNLFKKESFRSWDPNLFEKLKVPEHCKNNPPVDTYNITLKNESKETNQGSNNGFDQGSNQVASGFKNFDQGLKNDQNSSKKNSPVDNSQGKNKIYPVYEEHINFIEQKVTDHGSNKSTSGFKNFNNNSKNNQSGFKIFDQGSENDLKKINRGSENEQKETDLDLKNELKKIKPSNSANQIKSESNKRISSNNTNRREHLNKKISTESSIKKLRGNEKKFFFFILDICMKKNSFSTGLLLSSDIKKTIEMSKNSRETCIKRLTKKGLLLRGNGKSGERSTLSFYIPEKVKKIANNFKENDEILIRTNILQSGFKNALSSSSLYINTTTKEAIDQSLNTENKLNTKIGLIENWSSINILPLETIGFSLTQLKQLFESGLCTPEVVQDSIYHFAFGLSHNEKTKSYQQPLNVLMGVLRKGGAWTEKNYESPQVIATRELLERKKNEQEVLNKLENELYETGAENWMKKLSIDEKSVIINQRKATAGLAAKHIPDSVCLKAEYREKIWPLEKENCLLRT